MEIGGMEMSFERRELVEFSVDDAVMESLSESLLGSTVISLIGTCLLFGQFCYAKGREK